MEEESLFSDNDMAVEESSLVSPLPSSSSAAAPSQEPSGLSPGHPLLRPADCLYERLKLYDERSAQWKREQRQKPPAGRPGVLAFSRAESDGLIFRIQGRKLPVSVSRANWNEKCKAQAVGFLLYRIQYGNPPGSSGQSRTIVIYDITGADPMQFGAVPSWVDRKEWRRDLTKSIRQSQSNPTPAPFPGASVYYAAARTCEKLRSYFPGFKPWKHNSLFRDERPHLLTEPIDAATRALAREPERFCFNILFDRDFPFLAEYGRDDYVRACRDHKLPVQQVVMDAVEVYQTMKTAYNVEKHVCLAESRLKAQVRDRVAQPDAAVAWLLQRGVLVADDSGRLFLFDVKNHERAIAYYLQRIGQNFAAAVDPPWGSEFADDPDQRDDGAGPTYCRPEALVNTYAPDRLPPLCSEQMAALDHFIRHPVTIVEGSAGSGKTTLLKAILDLFPAPFLVFSFQGKNVNDVRKRVLSVQGRFSTGHKICSIPLSRLESLLVNRDLRLVVIEESSLMYPDLLASCLARICSLSRPTRIIFTGDGQQLPSIRSGNLLYDLCQALPKSVIRFSHNHRAFEECFQSLSNLCGPIRAGQASQISFDGVHTFLVRPTQDGRSQADQVMDLVQRFRLSDRDTHVLTYTNKMGQLLNDRMRQHFNGNEEVRRGAKILFKKNFWAAEIFTNEVYFVRDIFARFTIAQGSEADDEDEPVLLRDIGPMELGQKTAKFRSVEIPLDQLDDQLPPGFSERYLLLETTDGMRQEVLWDRRMRLQLRFAYCTTIHARQGSEDRSIIYVMPYDLQYEHRQTLYTGLTRARENVFFLGQPDAMKRCIQRPPESRPTGLQAELATTVVPVNPGYEAPALFDADTILFRSCDEAESGAFRPKTTLPLAQQRIKMGAAVASVPRDVWWEIFRSILRTTWQESARDRDSFTEPESWPSATTRAYYRQLLTLCGVCSSWRKVIDGSVDFWLPIDPYLTRWQNRRPDSNLAALHEWGLGSVGTDSVPGSGGEAIALHTELEAISHFEPDIKLGLSYLRNHESAVWSGIYDHHFRMVFTCRGQDRRLHMHWRGDTIRGTGYDSPDITLRLARPAHGPVLLKGLPIPLVSNPSAPTLYAKGGQLKRAFAPGSGGGAAAAKKQRQYK